MKVFVEKALLLATVACVMFISALLTVEELIGMWVRRQVTQPVPS